MIRTRTFLLPRLAGLMLLGSLAAGAAVAADPVALPAWEQLTTAQREQLIAPMRERWNAEPAQRQRMLDRAARWQQMTPEQRKHAHRGMKRWEHMSAEQRAEARALYSKSRGLDPAARKALKAKWRAMTPEQRSEWVKANPAPARQDGGR